MNIRAAINLVCAQQHWAYIKTFIRRYPTGKTERRYEFIFENETFDMNTRQIRARARTHELLLAGDKRTIAIYG